jgi:predicted Zn-dependent peptidase
LKKNLDATLKLLEEKLLSPGFRDEDFKLAKKNNTKRALKMRRPMRIPWLPKC